MPDFVDDARTALGTLHTLADRVDGLGWESLPSELHAELVALEAEWSKKADEYLERVKKAEQEGDQVALDKWRVSVGNRWTDDERKALILLIAGRPFREHIADPRELLDALDMILRLVSAPAFFLNANRDRFVDYLTETETDDA